MDARLTSPRDDQLQRAEMDALSRELGDRASIRAFSRALAAFFVAVIGTLALGKIARDSARFPLWGWPLGALDVVLWYVVVTRALRGRRLLRGEADKYRRLVEARRRLGIDPPPPGP